MRIASLLFRDVMYNNIQLGINSNKLLSSKNCHDKICQRHSYVGMTLLITTPAVITHECHVVYTPKLSTKTNTTVQNEMRTK